jgi:hypothetical protein
VPTHTRHSPVGVVAERGCTPSARGATTGPSITEAAPLLFCLPLPGVPLQGRARATEGEGQSLPDQVQVAQRGAGGRRPCDRG